MIKSVDEYLVKGCMRCPYGNTPKCKIHSWKDVLLAVMDVVASSPLEETVKWGSPVYTHHGKNVVSVSALKDAVVIGFFKGSLLKDPNGILEQQGNIQASRIIKIRSISEVNRLSKLLPIYIDEAIEIEESGHKVVSDKIPESMPEELITELEADTDLKKAFFALTPGRQRGYIIHFSSAKQSSTRIKRIEKYKNHIRNGIGMHDHYKKS